jgi:hypothetical protein
VQGGERVPVFARQRLAIVEAIVDVAGL